MMDAAQSEQFLNEWIEKTGGEHWSDLHHCVKMMLGHVEALSAENERLREALGWFLNDSRFVVQVGGNPNVVPQMIEAARAALGDK